MELATPYTLNMSSSPDDALIDLALQDFSRQLHAAFPLRNFGEFHDEEQLKEKILLLKENVTKTFFPKVWNRDREKVIFLLKKLRERMSKEVIAEWTTKNEKHKIKFMFYLQRRAEKLCEDFEMALEDYLLMNPDMQMDSLKNHVDCQKAFAVNYFDGIWKSSEKSQIKEERRAKMVKNLDAIGEEVLDKHKHFLERKSVDEGKKQVDEVKTILVEKSRQLKSYVDSHPGRVSKRYLKAEVEEMKKYLSSGKSSEFRANRKETYSKVVEILEDGIKFLAEEGTEEIAKSPSDFIQWVERFDLKLRSYCISDGKEKEDPFGSLGQEQEELEPERRAHMEGCDDSLTGNNKDREEGDGIMEETRSKEIHRPEPVVAAKKRTRLRRSRPMSSSARDKNHTLKNDRSLASDNYGPVPKKHRTSINVSKKTKTKADSFVDRQTSGLNDKTFVSAQATPSRRSSRLKKNFHAPNQTLQDTATAPNHFPSSSFEGEVCARDDESNTATNTLKRSPGTQLQSSPRNINARKADAARNTCDQCGKEFSMKSRLVGHMWTHTGEKPFKCMTCDKQFTRNNTLLAHIRTHTGKARFICKECDRRFNSRAGLHRHMLAHEGKLPFGCSYCDQRCPDMLQLMGHLLTHTDERPFSCITCQRSFCLKYHLIRHIRTVHQQPKENADKQANDSALEYLRNVTENPNYDGDTSSMAVLSHAVKKANLRIPGEMDRATTSRGSRGPNPSVRFDKITILGRHPPTYKCDVCEIEIKRKCDLKHHGKNCKKKGHKCNYCEKIFPKMSKLAIHLRRHTGEKPFKCPTCNKQFAFKCSMLSHSISHIRNLTCDKCKQSFSNPRTFKRHMLRHEGKLPFGCSYCDQRFPAIVNLMQHVLIHSDERPFHCSSCDKNVSEKFHLVQHLQNVHHQTKDDAMKQANDASAEYLKKVTKNPNYDGDISNVTVLSHAVKKANLKIPEKTNMKSSL